MNEETATNEAGADALRDRIMQEMVAALERLCGDFADMDASLILRLSIGYLADVHARGYGHAATVKALIAITRRGLWTANEELTATRN